MKNKVLAKILTSQLRRFKDENERLQILIDAHERLLDVQDKHIIKQDKKVEAFKLILEEYR